MSFNYAQLNVEILDRLREVCAKPSTQWTDDEARSVDLILAAIRMVANQRKPKSPEEK